MSEFDKIIKEKVELFEVPYNDAHWTEMESKLNSIKATKLKTNIFSAAAIVTVLSIGAYLIFGGETKQGIDNSISTNNLNEIENTENNTELKNNGQNNQSIIIPENNLKNSQEENNETLPKENENIITENIESNNVDNSNHGNSYASEEENNSNTIKSTINVNAEFIVYNNRVCLGETVSFESMENDRPVSYLWNFGDGNISRETNPKHNYETPGKFNVTLTLIDKQSGTEHTTIQHDIVTILSKPNVRFAYSEESVKHDDNKLMYPYTTFKVKNSLKNTTYEWTFGNGESSSGKMVRTIHKKAANYLVKLTAKDENGCLATIEKTIKIKNNFILYAPNGLRLNPDNPENGIFMPKALVEWDIPFEMVITNKSGKVIYKTSDKNEGWNGKLNNTGQQMQEGIYFWKIVTKDFENNPHYHQGEIKLVK